MKKHTTNIIGKRFGKLVVDSRVEDFVTNQESSLPQYLCRCDCGNEFVTLGRLLRIGYIKECPNCHSSP